MKVSEIKKGRKYNALVNKKLVVVEVTEITGKGKDKQFKINNTSTGRSTQLTADKFQNEYEETLTVPRVNGEGTIEIKKPEDRPPHWTDAMKAEMAEREEQMVKDMVEGKWKDPNIELKLQGNPKYGQSRVDAVVKAAEGEQSLPPSVTSVVAPNLLPNSNGSSQAATVASSPSVQPQSSTTPSKPGGFSAYVAQQQGKTQWAGDMAPHLIVEARAGTGKTTTLVTALKVLKGIDPEIVPSPQQRAVWEAVKLSKWHKFTCFVAFNVSIVYELKERVPQGVDCKTMHSMGYGAVRKNFRLLDGDKAISNDRVNNIIGELYQRDIRELRKEMPTVVSGTRQLVSKCKMNLIDPYEYLMRSEEAWQEEVERLARHYDIDVGGYYGQAPNEKPVLPEVARLIPSVLDRCKEVDKDKYIDNDDQIWLPVVLNLPMFKYDVLFVDECQDLNRCQHELIKKAGHRLILCGDPHQAIYGFAGADCESMKRLEAELKATRKGCKRLLLTVTRRCGKKIVGEAKTYVPEFDAHPDNGEGEVKDMLFPLQPTGGYGSKPKVIKDEETYIPHVLPGDMVVCRTVAPLVGQYFKFLKLGKRAAILGKNVGDSLVSLVNKMGASTIPELVAALDNWLNEETLKENAKRNPSESYLVGLHDRYETIMCFTEGAVGVQDVINRINAAFQIPPGEKYIRMSSIHKAKGLESDRVFYLTPAVYPGRRADKMPAWQWEQELNLKYVAITRAKKELVYVV